MSIIFQKQNEIVNDITSFIDDNNHISLLDMFHFPINSFFRSVDTIINTAPMNYLWHTYVFKVWIDRYFTVIVKEYVWHEHDNLWKKLLNEYNIDLGSQYNSYYTQMNKAILNFTSIEYNYKLSSFELKTKFRQLKMTVLNYLKVQKILFNHIRYKQWKSIKTKKINKFLLEYYKPYLIKYFYVIGPILYHEYYSSNNNEFIKEQAILHRLLFKCSYSKTYKKKYVGWVNRLVYNIKPWWA
jgi:hypothetical protein